MKGRILVGTASWSDPGFVADWYPRSLAASERLPYYAQFFNLVELNSSFYGIPSLKQVEKWCSQTPDDFLFDVKLHKVLSRHSATLKDIPPEIRKFAQVNHKGRIDLTPELEEAVAGKMLEVVSPFSESGKLGAMLLQLSPAFSPRSNSLSELDHVVELFKDQKLAIEFRNKGWVAANQIEEMADYCAEHRVTFVAVDAPETEHFTAFPYLEMVTNPSLAYMRCHGRNAEGYVRGRSVAKRFNHQYSEAELEEIASRAETLAQSAAETHVIYNNNASDYAIQSAARFQEIISHSGLQVQS
jgi:uncharacterized protein YecE (DUF72 family)